MAGMSIHGDNPHQVPVIRYTVKPHPRGGWLIGEGPLDCIRRARWDTAKECVREIKGTIFWLGLSIDVYDREGKFYRTVERLHPAR